MNKNKPDNLICEIKFGSHLYGTNTEASDEDYIGIFMPTMEDIFLGRIPKTANSSPKDDSRKNEAGELDATYYSLHHFLRLATQGQTVAIDMLFAPESMVFKDPENGWIWDEIQANRQHLLSKKMNAFVGYARGQAAKYSLKGERLNQLREALAALADYNDDDKLVVALRDGVLEKAIQDKRKNPQDLWEVQIGGKWFGETTSIKLVHDTIHNLTKRYGSRAEKVANSSAGGTSVDWKAMSHAVRVSRELIEILSFGRVNFPLVDAPLLLEIKQGKRPLAEVQDILDRDLAFVEVQAAQSHLPEKVDHKRWDDFLIKIVEKFLSRRALSK